jgi:hypothetical protein
LLLEKFIEKLSGLKVVELELFEVLVLLGVQFLQVRKIQKYAARNEQRKLSEGICIGHVFE